MLVSRRLGLAREDWYIPGQGWQMDHTDSGRRCLCGAAGFGGPGRRAFACAAAWWTWGASRRAGGAYLS
eukprot:12718815-Prorocentrum_lima.AAC.1